LIASEDYIRSQQVHHQVQVIDDRQKRLSSFTAEQDTATPAGVAE